MKETFGIANAKNAKPPNPKPSPKDFVWPSQRDHDDAVARKIAASLQELLPARGWKHTDLARELYGGVGPHNAPRNVGATRRWVVAEHPIPNEESAGYIAQVLDIPVARLLEPEGKFSAFPSIIRGRSDSKRFPFKGTPKTHATKKKAGKTPGGKDREKQRAYNKAYRAKLKAEKLGKVKHKHTKRAHTNGGGEAAAETNGMGWVLDAGIPVPEYQFASSEDHPGHLKITIEAVVPHPRAMAILHMLEYQKEE